ncbi:MAG: V-type ATPase subunit [Oscillospiraceae bacterium]|nr:V-type ATPase subunit [Oscillospiraceae bacterium]
MPAITDTDYLFLSTRVRALESNMLTRDRMERILESKSDEDAMRVLAECGYDDTMEAVNMDTIGQMLAMERNSVFNDLYTSAPDPALIDVFRVKYDYNNLKVILKSDAMGKDADDLLVDIGRIPAKVLREAVHTGDLHALPSMLQHACLEGRETLNTTHDPQMADFVLDRIYFEDMLELAQGVGSNYLSGYVRVCIDVANLRSVVRTMRLGKGTEFLEGVLFAGGNVDRRSILNGVTSGASLEDLFTATAMADAAAAGNVALHSGTLTVFEKACDNAVVAYLKTAKYVPFGEAPVVAFFAAKDLELTAIRIMMAGRMAGLDADAIRERLRDSYV